MEPPSPPSPGILSSLQRRRRPEYYAFSVGDRDGDSGRDGVNRETDGRKTYRRGRGRGRGASYTEEEGRPAVVQRDFGPGEGELEILNCTNYHLRYLD